MSLFAMFEALIAKLGNYPWIENIIRIAVFFLLAWLVSRLAKRLAARIMALGKFAPRNRQPRPERQETLRSLISSAITFIVFLVAILLSIGLFVGADTLIWMVGLFSAAFGLGARPLISDFLSGAGFIFEDTYAVGEKIEVLGVEGIVEAINLRTTLLRSPSGELYVIPNGEIRTVRNFSRGRFSLITIKLTLPAEDLTRAIPMLKELGDEAVSLLPNLLEPWQILSETGVIGLQTELTLQAKARFGKAADMRPRLLALVHEKLAEAEIILAG